MEDYEHKEWVYVVGLIFGIATCWHVPFWVADWIGYRAELDVLAARAESWEGWASFAFQVGLVITGGVITLVAGVVSLLTIAGIWVALVATGKWVWQMIVITAEALAEAIEWLVRGILSLFLTIVSLVWEIVSWPFRTLYELIADFFGWIASKLHARKALRRKLKAAYREEYSDDFHSFRAFVKYWKALQRGEQPPYPNSDPDADIGEQMYSEQFDKARRRQEDERKRKQQNQKKRGGAGGGKKKEQRKPNTEKRDHYQAALKLLGLSEPFTKAELGARYKMAMKKAHPDVSGDARFATRLNMARDLILKTKGWK